MPVWETLKKIEGNSETYFISLFESWQYSSDSRKKTTRKESNEYCLHVLCSPTRSAIASLPWTEVDTDLCVPPWCESEQVRRRAQHRVEPMLSCSDSNRPLWFSSPRVCDLVSLHTHTCKKPLMQRHQCSPGEIRFHPPPHYGNQVSHLHDSLEIILLGESQLQPRHLSTCKCTLSVSLDELSETEWNLSLVKRLPRLCLYQILTLQAAFEVNYEHIVFMIEWTFYKMHTELTADI